MASLETIIATVNRAVPHHDRTIIRPDIMSATRTASCFGRAALVGAGILAGGLPRDGTLSLLISEAHGLERAPGAYWFGHTALVLDSKDQRALIETARSVALGNLDATTWQRGVLARDQGSIVGLSPVAGPGLGGVPRSEVMAFLSGIVDETFLEARDRYHAYPFEEGVLRYQQMHPDLSAGPIIEVSEYADLYARLSG